MAGATRQSSCKPGKIRDRTFTGCWTCRQRKVKCGLQRPNCHACERLGLECGGYGAKVIWAEGDSDSDTIKSVGRRYIDCELTWSNLPVLDSDLVDFLIARCDPEDDEFRATSIETLSVPPAHNPFSMFQLPESNDHQNSPLSLWPTPTSVPAQLSIVQFDIDERQLFHHYVNHVAVIMMPFEHARNPWTSSYPAVALQQSSGDERALYHAILAHSAFHLAHLSTNAEKWSVLATRHYNCSIRTLMKSIEAGQSQYAPSIATIMTLLMSEVYCGRSQQWKHHLRGARTLLKTRQTAKPWMESDFACISTQSLFIISIIEQTTNCLDQEDPASENVLREDETLFQRDSTLLASISSTLDFGFTIGATKEVIQCVSRTTILARSVRSEGLTSAMDDEVASILACLRNCESSLDALNTLSGLSSITMTVDGVEQRATQLSATYHQLKAFILGCYIYFYRVIFNLPPQRLTSRVASAFQHVASFSDCNTGNFSLWPAFIAAVEAYTTTDITLAQKWLDHTLSFGLGSRLLVKRVVEEVWHRRRIIADATNVDQGLVPVDWREVMRDLNIDVLLV